MKELGSLVQDRRAEIFSATKDGEIAGLVVYTNLPWETKIFGTQMGVLKYLFADLDSPHKQEIGQGLLEKTIGWARTLGIEFLLCKVYTDDILTIHALEKQGFLLMDTLLEYVYDSHKNPIHAVPRPQLPDGAHIRSARDEDVGELLTVAQASFQNHFGRFHADERIPHRQAMNVYSEWVRSSCAGYADWVKVAEIDGKIAGYSIWRKPSPLERNLRTRLGHYSIGAVHPEYHRRGLFTALTFAGMESLEGIVDSIEGPTHINNFPVQRAYGRLHWSIRDARHAFHKWLEE